METVNNYNHVYEDLRKYVCVVNFTKLDGSERVMRCTLREDMLPEAYKGKSTVTSEDHSTIRVFDLSIGAWRSFRLNSVNSVVIED